ncbi:extracellular solute-binding protein [Paenibacillus sp.]|uniref:extracellular solute-binding protein n=1 Tax=Paenibacillus sp. TaxID=58172 RepID=UPI0028117D2E|nr:extracellular solute-binding protein [Paenibacillus sp.]
MARPSRSEFTARIRALADRVREDIASGALQPGDYLPSEVELGGTFGLSKESVRKALDALVGEGLIVKMKRVGNQVVRPPERKPDRVDAAAGGERTTLRFAYYPSLETEARMASSIAAFERAYPTFAVRAIPTPFPAEYAEHGIADVIALTNWDALKWKERDASFARLGAAPRTEAAHASLFAPFLRADGRAAAAPFVYSPIVLCYNREHLAACSLEEPQPDWTWYTLLKAARVLGGELGVTGFASHMQSVNRWTVFLLQNGFRFQEGEGARAADHPALWDSLRVARELVHQQEGGRRFWTENDADAERWFQEGRVSMIMTSYFGLNRLLQTGIDYGVARLPRLRYDATLLLVTGLAVAADTKHAEAAEAFVRFLCGREAQLGIRRDTLTLPAHPEALAVLDGFDGNRPSREPDPAELWDACRDYEELRFGTSALEAIREELKGYWSKLEDETEASLRLESLLLGK